MLPHLKITFLRFQATFPKNALAVDEGYVVWHLYPHPRHVYLLVLVITFKNLHDVYYKDNPVSHHAWLASQQPQVLCPPPPSLIHMLKLEFVGLLSNPKRIFEQLQKLEMKLAMGKHLKCVIWLLRISLLFAVRICVTKITIM